MVLCHTRRMSTIIDQTELKSARDESLTEMEKTARQLSKRALPAKKQALAEIEDTLRRIRQQWTEQGLVA